MSEESILILNMLREGKITAHQADSLLRAVRETAPPPTPPIAPQAPIPPQAPAAPGATDPATLAAMQNKLADLQGKIGELQGKLGAAQAARAAGQAASLAGKILDHVPRPEVDFNKIMEETMRSLSSLKNEAVRTAKVTARQVSHEARRAARQGRKSFKFDIDINFNDAQNSDRPTNDDAQPEATERTEIEVDWSGATALVLINRYGNIHATGGEPGQAKAQVTATKTAWSTGESEARILLQQVFVTNRVENGKCRIEVIAPNDAKNRLTVDYHVTLPSDLPVEIETSYGNIETENVSTRIKAQTISGKLHARHPKETSTAEAKLSTHSGNLKVEEWDAPLSALILETISGDVEAQDVRCGLDIGVLSRSGDILLQHIASSTKISIETISGDVDLKDGSAVSRLAVKTQSGEAAASQVHAAQLHFETVSGDTKLEDIGGTLTVRSVSGDIQAVQIVSPAVSLGTVSGDVGIAFSNAFSGALAGTTVSGDVTVEIPQGSSTRVDLNTTNGDLTCDLTMETQLPASEKHLEGKIGAGIGSIKLQSISGDLHITTN